ncbi:hypothetical protein B0O99DRAFT_630237 [Bisporella sp. PMI_857]|nr:hypothetical protein B0O99DRAFT_630237 [Bisporella sp. PMI_857]
MRKFGGMCSARKESSSNRENGELMLHVKHASAHLMAAYRLLKYTELFWHYDTS